MLATVHLCVAQLSTHTVLRQTLVNAKYYLIFKGNYYDKHESEKPWNLILGTAFSPKWKLLDILRFEESERPSS